ncbi:MAG: DUF5610 domain-containing protein [Bacillota bacterium]
MKIDKIPGVNPVERGKSAGKNEVDRSDKAHGKGNVIDVDRDRYTPGKRNLEKTTYDKPTTKIDQEALAEIKKAADEASGRLKTLVKELLARQGMTFKEALELPGEIEVDEQAVSEARQLISEGGKFSPEAVSDRIVNFAKSISGGDTEKYELLKDAIKKGFNEAREILGGSLPEISKTTYDLVMDKLDDWANNEEN